MTFITLYNALRENSSRLTENFVKVPVQNRRIEIMVVAVNMIESDDIALAGRSVDSSLERQIYIFPSLGRPQGDYHYIGIGKVSDRREVG